MSTRTPTRRRAKKHAEEEEHENSERWLLTYSDMITLLMVLFIVLFAISAVDQKKFNELKQGLAIGFGAPSVTFDGSTGAMEDPGTQPDSVTLRAPVAPGGPKDATEQQIQNAVLAADRARADRDQQAAQREVDKFLDIERKIHAALEKHGLAGSVRFKIDERGLVVTIVTDKVVFAGDRADLLPAGRRILDAIGPVLRPLPNMLEVDGHTNQLPVPTRNYPSAWELSASRAASVVRYLIGTHHVPEKRLFAAGFGDERPLYPPSDPRAVTQNRRVDIVVLSTLPSGPRALLPKLAPANQN